MITYIISQLPYLVIGFLIYEVYYLWKLKKLEIKKTGFQKKQLNIQIDALNRCLGYKRESYKKLVEQICILNHQHINAERNAQLSRKELIMLAAKNKHGLREKKNK
jgi:hypothetical protein